MQKTVKEWLKELTEPYRSQALENIENPECYADPTEKVESLYYALDNFTWRNSPQGQKYWQEVSDCIDAGEPIKTTPTPTERQTAEALLKEFADWWNDLEDGFKYESTSEAVKDFLTSKYGKG